MRPPSARRVALEKGSNASLIITVVSAMLAGGGWLLVTAAASMGEVARDDGTVGPALSPSLSTLLSVVSGFCVVLCAAMWAAHLVLSTLADAEQAAEIEQQSHARTTGVEV